MLFDKVYEGLVKNKAMKESGKYIGIPMPLTRLAEHIPVIEKGQSIGLLAGTGVGKSRFVRWMFIYHVYEFAKRTGYPVKIFYFPLEDNREKVYYNFICHYLKERHDVTITTQELQSKKSVIPNWILKLVGDAKAYFADLEKYLIIVDSTANPDEIYNMMYKWAKVNGTVEYKSFTDKHGNRSDIPVKYLPHSDLHTVVIVDNLSNFDAEKSQEERELMIRFAKVYSRRFMCNVFQFTVVQVMQMSFDKERQQFTQNGMSLVSKIEPSLDGIGEAKVIARSMHLIFGLFNPDRYELLSYPNANGYNIAVLGNKFRALKVLKSNDSDPGLRVGLLFDAIGEIFEELPLPGDVAMQQIYLKLKTGINSTQKKAFD